jgi:hypothetical protein
MHYNPHSFKESVEEILLKLSKWLQANLLTLNLNKTKFVQFLTKSIRVP